MIIAYIQGSLFSQSKALVLLPAIILCCSVLVFSNARAAGWHTISHNDMNSHTFTSVAIIENENGYTLEIYKDSVDAVRSRFTLNQGLIRFPDDFCPTFQIDNGQARNRSINDAPCLAGDTWAEFILGYVENGQINSAAITGVMNGVVLRFRFLLEQGDYRETLFSLSGSKRAVSAALGEGVNITPANSN